MCISVYINKIQKWEVFLTSSNVLIIIIMSPPFAILLLLFYRSPITVTSFKLVLRWPKKNWIIQPNGILSPLKMQIREEMNESRWCVIIGGIGIRFIVIVNVCVWLVCAPLLSTHLNGLFFAHKFSQHLCTYSTAAAHGGVISYDRCLQTLWKKLATFQENNAVN